MARKIWPNGSSNSSHCLTPPLLPKSMRNLCRIQGGLGIRLPLPGEVASLKHKLGDDPVEDAALVVQGLARFAYTLLASAQSPEVLHSLWHNVTVQSHYDATCNKNSAG